MMAGFVYWLARKSAKEAVAYPTLAQHFSEQREMFRYLLKVGFFCGAVMILMFFHGEPVASAIGGMLLGAISFVVAARLCIISIRRILTLWKMP
ncbi:hypothetical protein OAN22_00620 [Alphaproteobacteria bacterium]|nr:hypothetical protein [Alphaproteobacteria bacterium]